jgi:hypothetical protein
MFHCGDLLRMEGAMSSTPTRPGISATTLAAAEIKFCDYPVEGSTRIPYWTREGDLTPFCRYRLPKEKEKDGKKYHQDPGSKVYAYFPPNFLQHGANGKYGLDERCVILVEGEFKALSLLELGIYAVGIPSFIVYRKDENGYRHLLRDLEQLFDRENIETIYFLGDSDTATNFEFSRNAAFLSSAAWRAKVFLPRIPIGQPKGIDDCKAEMDIEFTLFFNGLIQDAIELPKKCEPPEVAIWILEREAEAIKALSGSEREKQFSRLVRLCAAAQRYSTSHTVSRLCGLARKIIGINAAELKDAINGLREEIKDAAKKAAAKPTSVTTAKPRQELILPGHHVEFQECGTNCFKVLALGGRYFVRDRIVFELVKDDTGARLVEVDPEAFRSHLEKYFRLSTYVKIKDQLRLTEGRCSVADATALLKSDAALELLPHINVVTTAAVFAEVDGQLVVLEEGYHASLGGIYIASKHDIVTVPLEEAVNSLLSLARDFLFVTPSDKSRFFAGFLSPALRMGGLLKADFPLLLNEADESQTGKSYAQKVLCQLFGEKPHIVLRNEEKMAIGSMAEQMAEGLIAGRVFIMFENIRGAIVLSMLESAIRGGGTIPCRVAYSRGIQAKPDRVCWLLSSNKAQTTGDLANRSVITRLRKQPPDHKFAVYTEGELLTHVEARSDYYLSCILAVLSAWHKAGKPRTKDTRHDFREWCQTLDWIVQNVLRLPPLLEGHQNEQKRISSPLLNWLRDLAKYVEDAGKVGEGLHSIELAQICADEGLEIPQCNSNADGSERAMVIGKLLKRLFKDETKIIAGSWTVQRTSCTEYDPQERRERPRYYHSFERVDDENNDQCA